MPHVGIGLAFIHKSLCDINSVTTILETNAISHHNVYEDSTKSETNPISS